MFAFTPSEELLELWVQATDRLITYENGWMSGHIRILNETREQDREMLTRDVRRYFARLGYQGGEAGTRIATRSFELLPEIVDGLEEEFGYGDAPEAGDITHLFGRDMCDAIHRDARITEKIYVTSDTDGYRIYGPETRVNPDTRPKAIVLE